MNKVVKILLSLFVILISVLMFVYAGIDDSPGGQLIGVVVGVLGISGLIMSVKKTSG